MKNAIYLLIMFLPFLSCKEQGDGQAANTSNQNDANEKRMLEFYQSVMNAHNPALIDSFCTVDFIDHQPFAGYPGNLTGLKNGFSDMMAGFPDITFSVEMIKSWGDTVMTKFRLRGTNSGSLMGMPATNKPIDVEGVDIVVLKNGKASEHWGYMEEVKMMNQLGMGATAAKENEESSRE